MSRSKCIAVLFASVIAVCGCGSDGDGQSGSGGSAGSGGAAGFGGSVGSGGSAASGGSGASGGSVGEVALKWTFDNDLEGWQVEERSRDNFPWGGVSWNSREGGVVLFDGVGYDGSPNSWIYIQVDLPSDARELRYRSSAHDRGDGAASLRIRLEPVGGSLETIQDWEELSTGAEGFDWVNATVNIAAWAGQTVTLFFEHADIDGGGNNQRWLDDIEIVP